MYKEWFQFTSGNRCTKNDSTNIGNIQTISQLEMELKSIKEQGQPVASQVFPNCACTR